jgi:hypothetical protein
MRHADEAVMDDYAAFLARKGASVASSPVPHGPLSERLFPHQHDLTRWALRRGRAAIFASTGLGKSRCEIEWARHVNLHTGRPVLMLTPLAVAPQMVTEGAELGVDVKLCRTAADIAPGVNVTNYDRLHHFDPSAFGGIVLDESSRIKHHDAKGFGLLCDAFKETEYRLCATATPAPNDYTELGTHAEFLGVCSRMEMLSEYFVHDGGETQTWRLKGHARDAFWRWVSTWGAVVRHPRDLGYETTGYDLPPLHVEQHVIPGDIAQAWASGKLFVEAATTLADRRAAKRGSLEARVAACAAQVNAEPDEQWFVWCHLNDESAALVKAIPGAVEITGSDDIDVKEERLVGFIEGRIRVIVTKCKIAGWGVNAQRCARMAFAGVNDSFEEYHQAVRRCWRFGQTRPVHVHIFASELEGNVLANLERKERGANAMAEAVAEATRESVIAEVRGITRLRNDYEPGVRMRLPKGLVSEAA